MLKLFDRTFSTILIATIYALTSANLIAEEVDPLQMDLEQLMQVEVITSASRYEQRTTEAPSSVTVITQKDIKRFGYRSMAELIRGVRSFYISDDRNYTYTGVRGFGRPADYDSRLLVLLNGHRLNDSVFSSSPLGFDLMIDIDLIERVEIVRGPSSTIYGTNAFFGVINIITRTPEDVGGAEIEANAAEYDTYQGRASFGQKFENGSELLISGTKFSSDGQQNLYFPEFDSSETNNGMAQNLDGEDGISLFGHMKWDEISVETGFVDRNKDVPTAAFDTEFNDPQFKTSDSRFFANVSYDGELSEKTRLVARVYYDWYEYNGNYPYDYAEEDDSEPFFVTNRDEARAERYGVQAHIVTSVIEGHKIIVGTEGRYDFNVDQENFDIDPEYQYLDTHNDDSLAAIYLQDDITLLDWLHLNVGTRYDHYDRAGLAWSPRAGLVARTAEDAAIKLLYGRAFRAPNLFELYYLDAETQKAPGSLSPETIDTYELIYEQHIDQKTRYTLSSYYYTIEDLISQTIDPQDDLLVYQNLEKVNAFGFEGEFEKRWHDGWSIKSSYSYQRAEDDFNNRQLSNSPQHMWKTHFVTPLIKEKLFSGFELIYLDARKTLSRASTDSYWLANLTLSTDNIFPGLDLSTSIYNLFDVDYGDPASTEHRQDQIPALGRTWRVQLTYRFSNPI